MQNRIFFSLFSIFLIIFSGCVKDGTVKPSKEQTDNDWIVEEMRDYYLWNKQIPKDANLTFSSDAPDFFESLLSMEDGKTRTNGNGQSYHYFYSAINKKSASTKGYMGDGYSFGFEYQYYYITNLEKYALQVLYVLPNSPAALGGIKRGNWVLTINGRAVPSTSTDLLDLLDTSSPVNVTFGVGKAPNDSDPTTIRITAGEVTDDPVLVHKTIEHNRKRIGYLVYNHFTDGDNGVFNDSMRAAFKQFANETLDEFILDLRYNSGGLVSCAQLLGTMLAPSDAVSSKKIFCSLTNNKNVASDLTFRSDLIGNKGANIDLKRLYVITSDRTASASEAIINGLNPFMDIIIVGEQTEGKNVGSVTYEDDRFDWELHPIVSKISNSVGFSDYANGFPPTPGFECDEAKAPEMFELGDKQEYILGKVLDYIANGTPVSKSSTFRSSDDLQLEPLYNSLDRKTVNSVILPKDYLVSMQYGKQTN